MRRLLLALSVLGLALLPGLSRGQKERSAQLVASTPPLSPEQERKTFHLPPGFEIQLVAAEPEIHKPLNLAFDDRGRLWLTESVEYPFPAEGARPRDAVKILDQFDDGGKAQKVTTYADGLNIPIGLLPTSRGALIHSIPNIYGMTGTERAEKRAVYYGEIGHRDTHGMTNGFTWGFDGWVYACHGFANSSTLKARDGSEISMQSGNTYRIRADGSHIEQFTHGQVNPFGICFDPLGNLYSSDCHTRPVMQLLRGGWYPSFGKPHDGLGFAPEMCTHDHGSTGLAGVVYYAADHFPPAFRDNLFIGNVVTNRVNRDTIDWHGSSPRAVLQPDFLSSDDPWFRPVDVKLGPDGALYVADFYNRIIGHYEVPLDHPGRDRERGRVWRIVYRGADGKAAPKLPRSDWTTASVPDLIADLAHANLVVRTKATNQLVERGKPAISPLRTALKNPATSPFARTHGLWALERLKALDDDMLLSAAHDAAAVVRVHAQRILAERRAEDWYGLEGTLALEGLHDSDAQVRRAAAEALMLHPHVRNLKAVLALLNATPKDDTHLVYMARLSLRAQVQRALASALFDPALLSETDLRAIADVAPGVHSPAAAAFLLEYVQHYSEPPRTQLRFVHHIARFGEDVTRAPLLAYIRQQRPNDLKHQAALLTDLYQGAQESGRKLDTPTQRWAEQLAERMLGRPQADIVQAGLGLVQALQLAKAQPMLVNLLGRKEQPEAQRAAALATLATVNPTEAIGYCGRLLGDASETLTVREQCANALAKINRPEARDVLLRELPIAPARLASVVAVGLASSPEGAEKLLELIGTGKASARLLQERPVKLRLQVLKLPKLDDRLAKLTAGLPDTDQRLLELVQRRRQGFREAKSDLTLGSQVFAKSCANCHQLTGQGAKVGPQLDGIGIRGLERLLEDILDPNRNVDQAFRSTTLVTKNGQLLSGLVLREEGAVIVLADAQGKEVQVPKDTIAERSISLLSPMPANVMDQLSEADFYHLLTFLLAQRPAEGAAAKPAGSLR